MAQPDSDDLNATSLVQTVFRSVWTEFYSKEVGYSQRCIDSLARPTRGNAPLLVSPISDSFSLSLFEHWDIETSNGTQTPPEPQEDPPSPVLDLETPFPPHASYESCTPCPHSIYLGDDPEEMPFIPFSDDPSFDYIENASHYDRFAWQFSDEPDPQRTRLRIDPDIQVIVLETAYILSTVHGMPLAEIDETAVLPIPILPTSTERGLIDTSTQRDYPDISGLSVPQIRPNDPPSDDDTRARVVSMVSTFCANLNCIQGYCARHLETSPMPPPIDPKVTATELHDLCENPCDNNCFLLEPVGPPLAFDWSAADIETLHFVLESSPDTLPCDLAVICRKPCREVFNLRRTLIPDDTVKVAKRVPFKPALFIAPVKLAPNPPCNHAGPCTTGSKCPCMLNSTHCERNCTCGLDCRRRWRGCRCQAYVRGPSCAGKRCVCAVANRECDPELCLPCSSRGFFLHICVLSDPDSLVDVNGRCKNSAIQQGRRKGTAVKATEGCGLGLFLTEPVQEGELISEYVGELIFEPTTQSRDSVSRHRGRNYLFDLDSLFSIDSAYAGNEARFLNHTQGNTNVTARLVKVNGENRIGFYALNDMPAGTELLFDYGQEFFKDHD